MKKVILLTLAMTLSAVGASPQGRRSRGLGTVGDGVSQPSAQEVAGKVEAGDEYAVYAAIIESIFGDDRGRSVVVRRLSSNNTVRDFHDPGTRSAVKSDFPKLDYKTLDDFVGKNARSYELTAEHFGTASRIILVAGTEQASSGSKSCEAKWRGFYRAYPTAQGYMIFTRVGFDPEKAQAFAYADYWSNCQKGEGQFYFLQKGGGRWKVTGTQRMWTSGF